MMPTYQQFRSQTQIIYLHFLVACVYHHVKKIVSNLSHIKKVINLQEFQRGNIAYLLGYTPTYAVKHKIPLTEQIQKNISVSYINQNPKNISKLHKSKPPCRTEQNFKNIERKKVSKNLTQIRLSESQKVTFSKASPYSIFRYNKLPSSGDRLPDNPIFRSSLQSEVQIEIVKAIMQSLRWNCSKN